MSSDERTLAVWLNGRSDPDLTELFIQREISPTVGWTDFYDAAAALLDPASIDRALAKSDRHTLTALAHPPVRGAAESLALIRADGSLYTVVHERVHHALLRQPDAFTPPVDLPPRPAKESDVPATAERAFVATVSLADLLVQGLHHPLTRTAGGTITAADRRRLLDAGVVQSVLELEELVAAGVSSGLLVQRGRHVQPSDASRDWLDTSSIERWFILVTAIRENLPGPLQTEAGGYLAPHTWPGVLPLDPDWPARADLLLRVITRLALLTSTGEEPPWGAALRAGQTPDLDALASYGAPEIDKVYLQADLTAIAPGPLQAPLDLRLRRIATREPGSLASSYRFTSASLAAGLSEGETADGIRDFLRTLSLTGIPQPLEYLIDTTAARHGLVRVSWQDGYTVIECADASVRETITVDQALRPLSITREAEILRSPVSRDAVYWALQDARYPVVAADADGRIRPLRRSVSAPAATPEDPTHQAYADLAARLRAAPGNSDTAWREREIARAVRARDVITVTVRLADNSERSFTLEASGLGGGRLRGLDRHAEIERTLPLSHIIAVSAPVQRTL